MADPKGLGAQNPLIKTTAKFLLKKYREETGLMLIEGARLVGDVIESGVRVQEFFATESFAGSEQGKLLLKKAGAKVHVITEDAAGKLSETRQPQGIFAVVEFAETKLAGIFSSLKGAPLILVAERISDPGNLGTIIRSTAALAGNSGAVIVAGEGACEPSNPKTVRASMGSIFRVPVATAPLKEALSILKSKGVHIAAAVVRDAVEPWKVDFKQPVAILIGSEAEGLPQWVIDKADSRVTIPMPAGTESLNAASTAAILLYEAARQRA